MWNLTGLIIVEASGKRKDSTSLPRLAYCLVALFAIGLCGYLLANVFGPEWESKPSRIQWPARQLSDDFTAVWKSQEPGPLQIVAADGWLGGLIAADARPRASVWIDEASSSRPGLRLPGSHARARWSYGVSGATDAPLAELAGIPGLRLLGVKSFRWPATPQAEPLRIGFGIVAPAAPASSNSSTR